MQKSNWLVTVLAVAVAVLATLQISQWVAGGRPAFAQSTGGEAGYVIALMGQEKSSRTPLIVIDAKEQTIMAYEYYGVTPRQTVKLVSARSYKYDKLLEDFQVDNHKERPSPRDIREYLEKQRR